MFIDETIKELVEVFKQTPTLADFLGWEKGVEYEAMGSKFMILPDNNLYELFNGNWYGGSLGINKYKELQQATKVEPKLKAYHVKDEYSYNCLMQELEKQGYNVKYADFHRMGDDIIYIEEDGEIMHSSLSYYEQYEKKDNYDLIEYHKEEPKFYAKIKGWELLRSKEYKGSDCGGKWFIYAPRVGEITTAPEYTGINGAWIASMTKTEWNKLGINSTNADFERVVQ